MSKKSGDQDGDMFGTEYTITPAKFVTALTWIIAVLLFGLGAVITPVIYYVEGDLMGALIFLVLIIVIGIPLFSIAWYYSPQKYKVSEKGVTIYRPAGNIIIPLKEITKVEAKDYKAYKMLRKWGNGGLFSISGKFWNKADGDFWCYGKNENFVMLHADTKWVVTPDDKELFITDVKGKLDKASGSKKSGKGISNK